MNARHEYSNACAERSMESVQKVRAREEDLRRDGKRKRNSSLHTLEVNAVGDKESPFAVSYSFCSWHIV